MAHEIETQNGRYSFARVEGTTDTWHGLGQVVPATATVPELLKAAGLDYTPGLAALFAEIGDEQHRSVDTSADSLPEGSLQFQPYRRFSDGRAELIGRPVTGAYGLVSPAEMGDYAQQLLDITAEAGNEDGRVARLDCAGSLRGGNRQFITLALDEVTVDRNGYPDVTTTHAVILSSFDKTCPFAIDVKSIRVVCNNTFSFQAKAIKKELARLGVLDLVSDTRVVLQHRGDMAPKINAGIAALAKAQGWARGFAVLEAKLQEIAVTEATFAGIVDRIFGKPAEATNAGMERIGRDRRDHLIGEFRKEAEFRGGPTGWAAVNAVTELVSHFRPAKMDRVAVDERPADFINLRLFGDGQRTGKVAETLTTEMLSRVLALA